MQNIYLSPPSTTMTSTNCDDATVATATNLVNPLEKKPSSIEWLQSIELGYITKSKAKKTKNSSNNANVDVVNGTTNHLHAGTVAGAGSSTLVVCFGCGKEPTANDTNKTLSRCSKCHVAAYCSRDCQVNDWKRAAGGHKRSCPSYARVATHIQAVRKFYEQQSKKQQQQEQQEPQHEHEQQQQPQSVEEQIDGTVNTVDVGSDTANERGMGGGMTGDETLPTLDPDLQSTLRDELFGRIRFYACPYAVFKYGQLGRGFLFLQSDRTLLDLSYATPKDGITGRSFVDNDPWNKSQNRAVLIHYLTLGEFDSELCREDFELYHVRARLQEAIDTYDPERHVVLLCRFRDGHMAVGTAVLVPDYGICQKLGQDYYASNDSGALQLNLDDL